MLDITTNMRAVVFVFVDLSWRRGLCAKKPRRGTAIDQKMTGADLREFTADLRKSRADLRKITADVRKFTADLRKFTARRSEEIHMKRPEFPRMCRDASQLCCGARSHPRKIHRRPGVF